jgi:predicted MFS family arabinose efflux permease
MKSFFLIYAESYLGLPRRAWYLALAQLVNSSGTMVIVFLSIYLTGRHGFSISESGQVISAFGVGMMIGTAGGGMIADRFGPHLSQRISLLLTGFTLFAMSYAESYAVMMFLSVLWGLFNGSVFPANASAMAAECDEKTRSRGFALIRLANNLGMTAAPVIGGFLARIDYNYLFYTDGATCLSASFLLYYLFHNDRKLQTEEELLHEYYYELQEPKKGYLSPFYDGRMLVVFIAAAGITAIIAQLFSTWPLYLKESEGFQESQIGTLFAISTLMIVVLQMPITHRMESHSQYAIAAFGALFYAIAFALMSEWSGIYIQLIALSLWTFGEMLVFLALMMVVSQLAPKGSQGKYQGVYSFSFSTGMVIGPSGGSYLADHYYYRGLWLAVALLALMLTIVLFSIDFFNRMRMKETPSGSL